LREDLSLQLRYSLFSQKVTLPDVLRNCNNTIPQPDGTFPTPDHAGGGTNCFQDGEASLAVRRELTQGAVLTSLVGYDLSYNTLDNNRNPTSGILAILRQDFAGVGGDVSYLRTTATVKSYYEVLPDIVGLLNLQGGIINGFGGRALKEEGTNLRMLDHFQMGPQLVRGFAPSGIGPRDLTQFNFNGTPGDALGGSMYWGASLEFQTPIYFLPKDAGVKVAVFADAGSVWNYKGPLDFPATGEVISGSICNPVPVTGCPLDNGMHVRASVGAGLLWASPFGPIRFDFAVPLMKTDYDRKQFFRFGGGTTF
jgi:outer membrane protein insertion porin family